MASSNGPPPPPMLADTTASNPITSVEQSGTGTVSDTLASSIITQASPVGTATGTVQQQGARPTRPAKAPRTATATAQDGDDDVEDEDGSEEQATQRDPDSKHESAQTTSSSLDKSINTAAASSTTAHPTMTTTTAAAATGLHDRDGQSAVAQPHNHDAGAKTAAPTAAASTAAPVAARSTNAAAARTPPSTTPAKSNKKKKAGLMGSLLACFGCGAAAAYDDSQPAKSSTSKPAPVVSEKATTSVADAPLSEKTNLPTTDDVGKTTASPSPAPPPPVSTAEVESRTAEDGSTVATPPVAAPSPTGVVLSQEETEGVTSGAVMAPGKEAGVTKTKRRKSGRRAAGPESLITQVPEPGQQPIAIIQDSDEEGSEDSDDEEEEEEEEDEEQNLIARGGVGIPIGEDGLPHPLLDDLAPELKGRKCLVLDLDETLVHSSFKMVHQADYVVPVEIENQYHNVYVIKRPGVDAFLKAMGEIYEVVIFTASLSKYADPVLDQLDIHRVVQHRLFRESCYNNKGNYVKDLSQLGRPMHDCIIIDNSPASYVFHVNNAVPISSWFNDPHDTELTDLVPFLTDLHHVDDVRSVLDAGLYQQMQFD